MGSSSRYGITATRLIIAICTLFAFSGCGDSRSGGSIPPTDTVIGQALLGPVCGATVSLFQANDLTREIYRTITVDSRDLNTAGTFEIPSDLLHNDTLYVVAATGGYDTDTDDNGAVDQTATPNNGSIHLAASGAQLKLGNFTINILTELVYNQIAYYLLAHYPSPNIFEEMDRCARLLLAQDINGDATIDHADLTHWRPADHATALRQGFESLAPCLAAVYNGESLAGLAKKRLSGMIDVTGITGDFQSLCIDNNRAYVTDADEGLRIIDITDRVRAAQLGSVSIPGDAMHVTVSGTYAYVAQWNIPDYKTTYSGIQVVDIADPSAPTLAGSAILPARPYALAVSSHYAYAACGTHGLQVIDISNPDSPEIGDCVNTPGVARDVILDGNVAYVADGESGLCLFDISDPATPVRLSEVETPEAASAIVVNSGVAYVLCVAQNHSGLQVINMTDPMAPVSLDYRECTPGQANAVALSGNYAYIVGGNFDPIVVDISNPAALQVSGSPTDAFDGYYFRDIHGVDGYVYAVGHSFNLFDTSMPAGIQTVGTLNISSQAVSVSGNYAYVLGQSMPWTSDGAHLLITDITDPSVPHITGRLEVAGDAAIDIANGCAYIAAGNAGVQIVDVSAPAEPTLISGMETSFEAADISVSGNYAYVAAGDSGLRIIDISNPLMPTIVGSLDTLSHASRISISGNHAFMAAWDNGLQIIDISDPYTPVWVSRVASADQTVAVSVSGNHAFLADSAAGLQVVDISDPIAPGIRGRVKTLEVAWHVGISGSYAYVADYFSGFQIIDISDHSNPVLVGYADTPGYAHDLSIAGDYAYIACGMPGLQILKIVSPYP